MKKLSYAVIIVCILLATGRLSAQEQNSNTIAENKIAKDEQFRETLERAEQGEADAQFYLGEVYYKSIQHDYKEAAIWYTKAAEQGHTMAQYSLAGMYEKGEGVSQNYKEALKWLTKAAEQGYAKAQSGLGFKYLIGKDISQNYEEAFLWFYLAADQGEVSAQNGLGTMYAEGLGVPQDSKEAVKWYRKAAEQGFASAQYNLGNMYASGRGAPEDYIEAYKWFNLAAAQDDELAVKNRGILKERMSYEQIAEAQRLSREFRPKKNELLATTVNTAPAQAKKGNSKVLRKNDNLRFSVEIPNDWHDSKAAMAQAFAPKSVTIKKIVDYGVIESFSTVYDGSYQLLVVTTAGQQKWPTIKACENYIRGAQVYDKSYKASTPEEVTLPNVVNKCAYFTEEVTVNASLQKGLQILVPREDGYFLMLHFRADPTSFDVNWKMWWEIVYSLQVFNASQ